MFEYRVKTVCAFPDLAFHILDMLDACGYRACVSLLVRPAPQKASLLASGMHTLTTAHTYNPDDFPSIVSFFRGNLRPRQRSSRANCSLTLCCTDRRYTASNIALCAIYKRDMAGIASDWDQSSKSKVILRRASMRREMHYSRRYPFPLREMSNWSRSEKSWGGAHSFHKRL